MQFPVSIELHRSFLLSFLLVLLHVLAAGSVSILPWPWFWRSSLLVVAGLSLSIALQPSRILSIRLSGREVIEGVFSDGHREALSVLPDSTVFGKLIVLRFRVGEKRLACHLALLPDQMTTEQFRVLRLWLRWHANEAKTPAAQSS